MPSKLILLICAILLISGSLITHFSLPLHPEPLFNCSTNFSLVQQLNDSQARAEGSVSIAFSGDRLYLRFDGLAEHNHSRYMFLRDVIFDLIPSGRGAGYYRITHEEVNRHHEDNLDSELASIITPGGNNTGDHIVITQPAPNAIAIGSDSVPLYGCRRP